MFAVITCLQDHDLRLVAVALLVCLAASAAAFGFKAQSRRARGEVRNLWLGLTGLVAGAGIWSTHFISMLAYQPSLQIAYDPVVTLASLVLAIAGMGLAFALPVTRWRGLGPISGGVVAGLTIAAMHYLGIAAIHADFDASLAPAWVIASILEGVIGATAAFVVRKRLRGAPGWVGATLLLWLSVGGLHFTAMVALKMTPDPRYFMPVDPVGRGVLAMATLVLASLVMGAASALYWAERLGQRATISGLAAPLNAVPMGVAFYDTAERLLACNEAFARLAEEIGAATRPGATRRSAFEAARAAGWFKASDSEMERLFASARKGPFHREVGLPDGRWFTLELFPCADGGSVVGLVDITHAKARAQALADARDAAEAASQAKSAFLANMSHEIRTPLNGVLGIAEVLRRGDLSPQQRQLVETMCDSGELLKELLTDLLDLARVEAGAIELRPEPVDLRALVDSVSDLFSSRAQQKGVTLSAEFGPGAADWVACDPLRLKQVIVNLVNNAVKFTQAGEVVIALDRDGALLKFEVRDTGEGFDEAIKADLFKRFRQADNSATRRHGGAGLGLAICEEYVRMMGGEIDCESQLGVGSTFHFTLTLPSIASPIAASRAAAAVARNPTLFRVLIVDDDAVNRQAMAAMLEHAGMEFAEAEDGRAGLDLAIGGGFDAVLMDIQMPVMDGLEAIRRIRAWERDGGGHVPIYIVSANGLEEHVKAGIAAGADGHISKPISFGQILGVLEPHRCGGANTTPAPETAHLRWIT